MAFGASWLLILVIADRTRRQPAAPSSLAADGSDGVNYCSAPFSGAEGHPPAVGKPPLTLRAVAVIIRHGDRSAIHTIHNTTDPPPAWRCVPSAHEGAARREWPALRAAFVVRRLSDGATLARSLRPAVLATDGATCEPGQLTPRGFEQHVRLGRHLASAYSPLLDRISEEAESNGSTPIVFARSTDYGRTLLSAAGLLLGLLRAHPSLRPSPARPLTLFTEEDETADIMHGVGLAASSHPRGAARSVGGANAETTRDGRCAAASDLARRQLGRWRPDSGTWSRLTKLFGGAAMGRLLSTGIADALYARSCHELQPPCGAAGCVDEELQHAVSRDADAFYCLRFAGADGGLAAAKLSMLPLLLQVASRLEKAASRAGGDARLLLFSGHDTVVAPLLAAIGGLRAPGACRWPPYASHVAFEVWERASSEEDADDRRAGLLFVRVLFNGRVITRYLTGCDALMPPSEHCPLDVFTSSVRALAAEFGRSCGLPIPN